MGYEVIEDMAVSAEGESVKPGMKAWVLTSQDDGEDAYCSWGVYSTRGKALEILAEDIIGRERADRIAWEQSEDNPEFFDGAEPGGKRWLLCTEIVDEV